MKRILFVVLALLSMSAHLAISVGSDKGKSIVQATTTGDVRLIRSPAHVAPAHITPHGHLSSLSNENVLHETWSDERRARYKKTIENRRLAVASGSASKVKGAPWTQAQREKFRNTIATRTVTDEKREKWSKAHQGARHTEESKFLMGMRKLGWGQLPEGERVPKGRRQREQRRTSYAEGSAASNAQKARWAKVRALENQYSAGESSISGQA